MQDVYKRQVVAVEATERAILLAKLAKASLYVAHVTAKGAMAVSYTHLAVKPVWLNLVGKVNILSFLMLNLH